MTPVKGRSYKVSEITALIKELLEGEFFAVSIEGEISNFKISSTGHYYFTLKDSSASISGVIFNRSLGSIGYIPRDGDLVKVTGNVNVYARSGSYQIVCSRVEKSGEGDILAELEKRKQRLAAEGLFDSARKKAIPLYPKKIGLVTSPSGAAIKDIFRVLKRRNNTIDIVVLPAPVQGDEAAALIASQIRRANMFRLCDVLLVTRGGGAPEDLLPFSDEEVVRAVAASEIPVISAVGHEIDVVLSDFAADLRAPTPSAAAEIVSRETGSLLERIRTAGAELERNFTRIFDNCAMRLDNAREDNLRTVKDVVTARKHRFQLLSGEFRASSPEAILKKGYAAVYNRTKGKQAVSSALSAAGDELVIHFADGVTEAIVKGGNL